MEVEEICRKLKPVIGRKAEQWWLAYLAEDPTGKREIETALNILAAKHLSGGLSEKRVHLSVPPQETAHGDYNIGQVIYNGRTLHPFGLREEEWIQHTAIFGRSGAGKTNTVFIILENILDHKKPFLIFDWKRNYRDLLAVRDDEILVYTVGRNAVPFSFNPLIPPTGIDASTWLKKLIEIIAHAYYLGEGVMYLLQEALHAVYKDFGVYAGKPEKYPTFQDVLRWLEDHPAKGRKALWMDSALRGVKSICFGHMGTVVNTSQQSNIAGLLEKNVILELDSLTNADKTLIIESLLLWIHHYRLCQPERETLKHFLIIEEAHHILLRRTGAGSGGEAITDTTLREIRELGEAIVLVDQHPSLISVPAMGNTYTTIAMNVKHRSDVNALGGAMLLDDEQKELIGRLPIGEAVVKLQGRWQEPFHIQIPLRPIRKGSVSDEALVQRMAPLNVSLPNQAAHDPQPCDSGEAPDLSERELNFLIDVLQRPLAGAVERYRGLGLSRRKGNTIRESLINKDCLSPVDIALHCGKTVLVDLTETGRRVLRANGFEETKRRRESLEHDYWKQTIGEMLRKKGWTVHIELEVNGYTDIVAQKGERKAAIEIETGKSDWKANLQKNVKKGFEEIMILATRPEAYEKISKEMPEVEAEIWIDLAQKFIEQGRASDSGDEFQSAR